MNGLDFLRSKLSGRLRRLPVLALLLTTRCNSRCRTCGYWQRSDGEELRAADIASLLPDLRKLRVGHVLLSGGEALLANDVVPIGRMLHAKGIAVSLYSNGLTLAERAGDLLPWCGSLVLSVDTLDREQYRRIRGVDGLAALLEGIAAVKSRCPGLPLTATVTLQQGNHDCVEALAKGCLDLGFDHLNLARMDYFTGDFSDTARKEEYMIGREGLEDLRRELSRIAGPCDLPLGFVLNPRSELLRYHDYYAHYHGLAELPASICLAPWCFAVIDHRGDVLACWYRKRPLGNLRRTGLVDLLNAPTLCRERKARELVFTYPCACPLGPRAGSLLWGLVALEARRAGRGG